MNLSDVQEKLRLTEDCLHEMCTQEQRNVPEEAFYRCLNAFLDESTSVREKFKRLNDPRTGGSARAWRKNWKAGLTPDEAQLYDDLGDDRNCEHHGVGSRRRRVRRERVPLAYGQNNLPDGSSAYVSGVPPALSGDNSPPASYERRTYYYLIGDKERKTTDACHEYLELLKRMVAQFEADHS